MKIEKNVSKALHIEIKIPEDISAIVDSSVLALKGPKGEVKRDFSNKNIKMECIDKKLILKGNKPNKLNKKIIKSYSAHINNMLKGCLEGHRYFLKICSGHFPMNISVNDDELIVKNFLGEKVPRKLKIKKGASVKIEGDKILVESASKEIAGMVSSDIEQLTRRTRYDSRVFQDGVYIIDKDGKKIG